MYQDEQLHVEVTKRELGWLIVLLSKHINEAKAQGAGIYELEFNRKLLDKLVLALPPIEAKEEVNTWTSC